MTSGRHRSPYAPRTGGQTASVGVIAAVLFLSAAVFALVTLLRTGVVTQHELAARQFFEALASGDAGTVASLMHIPPERRAGRRDADVVAMRHASAGLMTAFIVGAAEKMGGVVEVTRVETVSLDGANAKVGVYSRVVGANVPASARVEVCNVVDVIYTEDGWKVAFGLPAPR